MSHLDRSTIPSYNSLCDGNLVGYFSNTKMRRHLRKSGLISRRGEIISENTYRLNMARQEHKKHVKDLLAQAIVHKTLDLERNRQAQIKRKLEEIAKIEQVRKVRNETDKSDDVLPYLSPRCIVSPRPIPPSSPSKSDKKRNKISIEETASETSLDKDVLPYLTPRSRPQPHFGPVGNHGYRHGKTRARSAPCDRSESNASGDSSQNDEVGVIYVDDDGNPVIFQGQDGPTRASNLERNSENLYVLDPKALRQYAMNLAQYEQGYGHPSPYLMPQVPIPPVSPRARHSARSRTGRSRSESAEKSPRRPASENSYVRLHRQEPPMTHVDRSPTKCDVRLKYHGWALHLAREMVDPRQEVVIEQQHCGGNTLTVFKDKLMPGSTFGFKSERRRGYQFSLTIFLDGRQDCRVSTCCEYRHRKGVRLGGKLGHFSIVSVDGAAPCYKCQVEHGGRRRKPKQEAKDRKPAEMREEVIIVKEEFPQQKSATAKVEDNEEEPVVLVPVENDGDETPKEPEKDDKSDKNEIKSSDQEDYEEDFEDSDSSGSSYSRGSNEEAKEEETTKPKEAEKTESKNQTKQKVQKEIEETPVSHKVVEIEQTPTKKKDNNGAVKGNRKVEGYSSEEEDLDGPRSVKVVIEKRPDDKKLPARAQSSRNREKHMRNASYRSPSSSLSMSPPESPAPPEKKKVIPLQEDTMESMPITPLAVVPVFSVVTPSKRIEESDREQKENERRQHKMEEMENENKRRQEEVEKREQEIERRKEEMEKREREFERRKEEAKAREKQEYTKEKESEGIDREMETKPSEYKSKDAQSGQKSEVDFKSRNVDADFQSSATSRSSSSYTSSSVSGSSSSRSSTQRSLDDEVQRAEMGPTDGSHTPASIPERPTSPVAMALMAEQAADDKDGGSKKPETGAGEDDSDAVRKEVTSVSTGSYLFPDSSFMKDQEQEGARKESSAQSGKDDTNQYMENKPDAKSRDSEEMLQKEKEAASSSSSDDSDSTSSGSGSRSTSEDNRSVTDSAREGADREKTHSGAIVVEDERTDTVHAHKMEQLGGQSGDVEDEKKMEEKPVNNADDRNQVDRQMIDATDSQMWKTGSEIEANQKQTETAEWDRYEIETAEMDREETKTSERDRDETGTTQTTAVSRDKDKDVGDELAQQRNELSQRSRSDSSSSSSGDSDSGEYSSSSESESFHGDKAATVKSSDTAETQKEQSDDRQEKIQNVEENKMATMDVEETDKKLAVNDTSLDEVKERKVESLGEEGQRANSPVDEEKKKSSVDEEKNKSAVGLVRTETEDSSPDSSSSSDSESDATASEGEFRLTHMYHGDHGDQEDTQTQEKTETSEDKDWTCWSCKHKNFATQSECTWCKSPKLQPAEQDVDKQTEGQSEEQTKLTVVNDIVDREQSEEKKPEELEKSKDNSEQPQEGETNVTSNDDDKTAADEQTEAAEESTERSRNPSTSEASENDNMHGGNDPENVASQEMPTLGLTVPSSPPRLKYNGSVLPLLEAQDSELEMSNMELNTSQWFEVCRFLETKDNLSSVSLRNMGMNDQDFKTVFNSLLKSPSKPSIINLNMNKLGPQSTENISELLKNKPSIEFLLLQGNPVGDEGIRNLVDGLLDIQFDEHQWRKSQTALRQDDSLDERDAPPPGTAADLFCHLKELDLGDTDMTDEGTTDIALLLEHNTDIRSLSLQGNRYITRWTKIGKSLVKNHKLMTLTLDHNKVGDEGMEALAVGLKQNTSVQVLDLANTGIGQQGGAIIIDLLKKNTTLIELTLTPGNAIPDPIMEDIKKYLHLNQSVNVVI